jgi:hypothetical protein
MAFDVLLSHGWKRPFSRVAPPRKTPALPPVVVLHLFPALYISTIEILPDYGLAFASGVIYFTK